MPWPCGNGVLVIALVLWFLGAGVVENRKESDGLVDGTAVEEVDGMGVNGAAVVVGLSVVVAAAEVVVDGEVVGAVCVELCCMVVVVDGEVVGAVCVELCCIVVDVETADGQPS